MLTLQYRLSSVFGSESIVVWNKLSNLSPNENNDDDDDDYDIGGRMMMMMMMMMGDLNMGTEPCMRAVEPHFVL